MAAPPRAFAEVGEGDKVHEVRDAGSEDLLVRQTKRGRLPARSHKTKVVPARPEDMEGGGPETIERTAGGKRVPASARVSRHSQKDELPAINAARMSIKHAEMIIKLSAEDRDAGFEGKGVVRMQSAYANTAKADEYDATLLKLAQSLATDGSGDESCDLSSSDDDEDAIGEGETDDAGMTEHDTEARRRSSAFVSLALSEALVDAKETKQEVKEPPRIPVISEVAEASKEATEDEGEEESTRRWKKLRAAAKAVTALKHISADHQVFGVVNHGGVAEATKRELLGLKEASGGVNTPWFILLPHSSFVRYWDVLVMLLLMYVTFIIPVRVCFFINEAISPEWSAVDIFELLVDCLFIFDILVNFLTAYHEEKTFQLVVSRQKIAARYISSWFIMDVIACIPINLILRYSEGPEAASINRIGKLARLPRMFRLLRLLRLMKLLRILRMTRIFDRLNVGSGPKGFKVFFYVSVVTHLVACVWFLIGSLDDSPENWLVNNDLLATPTDLSTQYTAALYWAFSTLTTVGFGDIRAQSDGERLFSILVMICGVTWYAYIVSTLSSLLSGWDRKSAAGKKRLQELHEFMADIKLSRDARERVREYAEYCIKHDVHVRGYNTETILKSLSSALRAEVIIHMNKQIIPKMPFLGDKSPQFVASVLQHLTRRRVAPSEEIIREGVHADEMFFLLEGRCLIQSAACSRTWTLIEGSYFGEIGCMLAGVRRASITALSPCMLGCLTKEHLNAILSEFPDVAKELAVVAMQRLKRLRQDGPKTHDGQGEGDINKLQSVVSDSPKAGRRDRLTDGPNPAEPKPVRSTLSAQVSQGMQRTGSRFTLGAKANQYVLKAAGSYRKAGRTHSQEQLEAGLGEQLAKLETMLSEGAVSSTEWHEAAKIQQEEANNLITTCEGLRVEQQEIKSTLAVFKESIDRLTEAMDNLQISMSSGAAGQS